MEKIPTALVRDSKDRSKVTLDITPGCEWVFDGEGAPTRKWDGTCVKLSDTGEWWARREVKPGKGAPDGFITAHFDHVTGKTQGWEPIDQSPFAKFHTEALQEITFRYPGTYELVGPKINGNPEKFINHTLLSHDRAPIVPDLDLPLEPATIVYIIKDLCATRGFEGVVWHHPDGRMAKLKGRDL